MVYHFLPVGKILDVTVTARQSRLCHQLRGYARNGALARRVDLGHNHGVGIVEAATEPFPQRARSAVSMWLKHGDHPSFPSGPHGIEGGRYLSRMMRVIIYEQDAGGLAPHFQPAGYSRKLAYAFADGGERDVQFQTHRDGGQSVGDVVPAGHPQEYASQFALPEADVKGDVVAVGGDIGRPDVRLMGEPIGDDPPDDPRQNGLNVLFIQAHDRRPIEGHLVQKLDERGLYGLQVAVMIEVLLIYVCGHSQIG